VSPNRREAPQSGVPRYGTPANVYVVPMVRFMLGALVAFIVLVPASVASATTTYTTDETVTFTAADADPSVDFAFVFDDTYEVLSQSSASQDVSMSELGEALGRLGEIAWKTCPVVYGLDGDYAEDPADPDALYMLDYDRCSAPTTLILRFRLPTMTRSAAKRYAADAIARRYRRLWRAAPGGHSVKCRPLSRTRHRCRVAWAVGDVIIHGKAYVRYRRRGVASTIVRYRIALKLLNDYCYSVEGQPREACERELD